MGKSEINGFGIFMYVLVGIAAFMALTTGLLTTTDTVMQQQVEALWGIKYILWAILFGVIALNCKK